ncbi:hypothetical protein V4R08_00905 [Nitrobacter sp. NHB1]|uniref:hypothetical protein n=1 Tax=Nitrobacter sp. NHB1 TaxID=3119830 RepID=UPI002FFFEA8F
MKDFLAASADAAIMDSRPWMIAVAGDSGKRDRKKKRTIMQMKSIVTTIVLLGFLPAAPVWAQIAANEHEFQQLSAALKANDAERQSAITTCIKQGIGVSLEKLAKLMGVPVEKATEAWCTRMTNGIANSKLTLADVNALNEGTVTPGAREVLKSVSDGK